MLRNVLAKTLWDQRRGIVGWSIGVAAVGVGYALFWPSINTPELAGFLEAYPEGLLEAIGFTDIASPEGYLGATTYGILGPVLMIIFGAVFGSRAIAGEEESGRLDVLLAHPVTRSQVLVQRAAAGLVAMTIIGAVLLVVMIAASGIAEFAEIGAGNLAAASIQLVLLGLFYGALALAVGAVTGRRGWALAAVALVAVVTYFANTLGPSVDFLAWSRDVSPFHYYSGGDPLRNGLQLVDSLVLVGAALVLVVVGLVGFRRRDIAV